MSKLEKVVYTVCILFMIWIVVSIIDTVCHNMTDYDYASWNMFDMFCRIRKGM